MYELLRRGARRLSHLTDKMCARYLLKKKCLHGAPRIRTFTSDEELRTLLSLTLGLRENARILEVGSYLGASTCYLAAGLRGEGASITCIDTWENETMPEGRMDTYSTFLENTRGIGSQLIVVRSDSNEVGPDALTGEFDLIFLDGDHSYARAKQDFARYSCMLAPQGWMVMHDSLFFEGVSRVIGEALSSAEWQIGGSLNNLFWMRRAVFPNRS